MKKRIAITLIILSSFQTLLAQEKNEIDFITSGKWYLEFFENDKEKKSFSEESKEDNWMKFYPDGKHEAMTFSFLNKGKWQLSEDRKKIKLINKGRFNIYEIIVLTKKKFILKQINESNSFILTFKK